METRLTKYQDVEDAVIIDQPEEKKAFILGNTRGIELQNLQDDYLVPVFSRDNVETISHNDFINTVFDAAQTFYQGQQFLEPNIRVSHEMKLRTRKGSGKLVENLTDEDSGSYYQRMMFIIEIPSMYLGLAIIHNECLKISDKYSITQVPFFHTEVTNRPKEIYTLYRSKKILQSKILTFPFVISLSLHCVQS